MPTFRKPRDLTNHLRQAAAEQQKELIITAQAWLGNSNNVPRDTGRMRSSWFVTEGAPSGEVAPEGADTPNADARDLIITFGRTYYLTNSLPYAAPIALGVNMPASWGGQQRVRSAPLDWFVNFRNSILPQQAEAAGQVIKRRFGL